MKSVKFIMKNEDLGEDSEEEGQYSGGGSRSAERRGEVKPKI